MTITDSSPASPDPGPVVLEVTRRDEVLELTLNRPEALNAFTAELHQALAAALKDAKQPDIRAVIITGSGRVAPSAPARTLPRPRTPPSGRAIASLAITTPICAPSARWQSP